MVDLEYWSDGIVGTCELIASKSAFRKAWIDGDHTITSIHCYAELYVQLTDDLFLDGNLRAFAPTINDERTIRTVAVFSQALKTLDQSIEGDQKMNDPATLLSSSPWAAFRECAKQVIALPYAQPYREGRLTEAILRRLQDSSSARSFRTVPCWVDEYPKWMISGRYVGFLENGPPTRTGSVSEIAVYRPQGRSTLRAGVGPTL